MKLTDSLILWDGGAPGSERETERERYHHTHLSPHTPITPTHTYTQTCTHTHVHTHMYTIQGQNKTHWERKESKKTFKNKTVRE